jgi:hypothetical protein
MERSIELLAGIQFLIIGCSHLVQPRVWVTFFITLRERGHTGVFMNGFLSLWFGSIVVAFHNVWAGLPAVLTAIGWMQVVKSAIAFVAPDVAMRSLARVGPGRAWEFQAAGVAFIAFSGLMFYVALRP